MHRLSSRLSSLDVGGVLNLSGLSASYPAWRFDRRRLANRASFPTFRRNLKELSQAARDCRNCDLWRKATQTVFGEGSPKARIMSIGEVPGNQEDLEGRSFVGPAGTVACNTRRSWDREDAA